MSYIKDRDEAANIKTPNEDGSVSREYDIDSFIAGHDRCLTKSETIICLVAAAQMALLSHEKNWAFDWNILENALVDYDKAKFMTTTPGESRDE